MPRLLQPVAEWYGCSIIQRDQEEVSLIRRAEILVAYIEYPLLGGRIPPERGIRCGGIHGLVDRSRRAVDDLVENERFNNAGSSHGDSIRIANAELRR